MRGTGPGRRLARVLFGALTFSLLFGCTRIDIPDSPRSGEGESCTVTLDCQSSLKCLSNLCTWSPLSADVTSSEDTFGGVDVFLPDDASTRADSPRANDTLIGEELVRP